MVQSKVQIERHIEREYKEMKSNHDLHIGNYTITDIVSPTLSSLLTLISPKLNRTMPPAVIGNIITSQVTHMDTDLQIALGILTRDSKKNVD